MIARSSAPAENASSTVYTPESRARASSARTRARRRPRPPPRASAASASSTASSKLAGAAQEVDDHRVLGVRVVVERVSVRLGLAQPLDGPQPAADGRLVRVLVVTDPGGLDRVARRKRLLLELLEDHRRAEERSGELRQVGSASSCGRPRSRRSPSWTAFPRRCSARSTRTRSSAAPTRTSCSAPSRAAAGRGRARRSCSCWSAGRPGSARRRARTSRARR